MNNQKQTKTLSYSARFKMIGKGMMYLVASILLLLYGLIFITNLMTQINHINTSFYYTIVILCYALIAVGFYLLWHKLSQSLTQAFSGLED